MLADRGNSHSRELQRRGAPSEKHSFHKHPVFAQTPQVEVPAARAVVTGGEYLQMSPGDEAGVAHAHVHRALRRVPADGHRTLLHHVLELAALQPGNRPRRTAGDSHARRLNLHASKYRDLIQRCRHARVRPFRLERSGDTGIKYKTGISGEHARPGQRLRPTAERKTKGESQPEEPQRG